MELYDLQGKLNSVRWGRSPEVSIGSGDISAQERLCGVKEWRCFGRRVQGSFSPSHTLDIYLNTGAIFQ